MTNTSYWQRYCHGLYITTAIDLNFLLLVILYNSNIATHKGYNCTTTILPCTAEYFLFRMVQFCEKYFGLGSKTWRGNGETRERGRRSQLATIFDVIDVLMWPFHPPVVERKNSEKSFVLIQKLDICDVGLHQRPTGDCPLSTELSGSSSDTSPTIPQYSNISPVLIQI